MIKKWTTILAAAALAMELRVTKLVYLSDVPGVLSDPADPESLIQSIGSDEADALAISICHLNAPKIPV